MNDPTHEKWDPTHHSSTNTRSTAQRLRRLNKEAAAARHNSTSDTPQIYTIDSISSDYIVWQITLTPSHLSIYSGGIFPLQLTFPEDYPVRGPSVRLTEQIPFHSNVDGDDGSVRMAELEASWTPAYTADTIVRTILANLDSPALTDEYEEYVVNAEAAALLRGNLKEFEVRVIEALGR